MIAVESASETDRTGVFRDRAPGSKHQTTERRAGLSQAFRDGAKAALRWVKDEMPPEPRRRRNSETGKAFVMVAKVVLRRAVQIPAEAYAATTAYLADTLQWLNLWDDNSMSDSDELDDRFDTKETHSPHL